MSKINYIQYYGLLEPAQEAGILEALLQVQSLRECWRPEIASHCRDLIKKLVKESLVVPAEEKEILEGNICSLLNDLAKWKKNDYAGNTDYENRFYAAINTAIKRIQPFYGAAGGN